MSTLSTGPRTVRPADNDIYTLLLIISALFLVVAAIYVGYRAVTMFGGLLPPAGA
jgi:hypothetical protein